MGRRSKRKKLIIKKLNAGQEVPDQDLVRNGLGRIVEENSVRIQKLKEEQEAEAKAAKLKAEAENELERLLQDLSNYVDGGAPMWFVIG